MPSLTLKNIFKSFGRTKVIEDVSLEIESGALIVLLGSSGCGKTTLLRLIAGLEDCNTGEIYLDSKRIDELSPKDRNVAMVFQNYSLYPHMTVAQNLAFPLKVAKVEKTEIEKRVNETADRLGLTDRLSFRPNQLSGGQRQRVALGRAIIREPQLFLLDEPLSNLDAELRVMMRREIVTLQKQLGVTTVYVTHDQEEALTMADSIALLNNGQVEQVGTPKEIYDNPSTLFTARFVGSPPINIIEAKIERHLLLPFGLSLLNNLMDRNYEKVLVGLRPERISIDPGGEFQGVIDAVEFLGDQYVIDIAFQDTVLKASGIVTEPTIGTIIKFSIEEKSLLFFDPQSGLRIS